MPASFLALVRTLWQYIGVLTAWGAGIFAVILKIMRSFLRSLQYFLLHTFEVINPHGKLCVSAPIYGSSLWNAIELLRNIPFHYPVFHVSVTGSLTWSHVHDPMLLTCFGVPCIFGGPHVWSSLEVCPNASCSSCIGKLLLCLPLHSNARKRSTSIYQATWESRVQSLRMIAYWAPLARKLLGAVLQFLQLTEDHRTSYSCW
jgi:hypothetical protein